jgi:ribose transport system ATP-binding protein
MADTAIDMRDITMSFNGVEVLKKVDFTLRPGEIKGLIGKNGAGKSTLLKIIEGLYAPVSGTISIFGKRMGRNMSAAERTGTIAMIFQDFSLIPDMTVVENIFLNSEPTRAAIIDDRTCRRKVEEFFARYAIKINPLEKIKNLSTSDMQMVEISKAIIREKKIILMDEPTAALEAEQVEKLFDIIGKLKAEGYSIVLISHHLKDIMRVCDSVTVLCDGVTSLSKAVKDTNLDEIIVAMFGKKVQTRRRNTQSFRKTENGPVIRAEGIASARRGVPVSFSLYPGEVLGVVGLKGAGKTELVYNLYGIDPITRGQLFVNGKPVTIQSPEVALRHKIFLIPENRQTLGLIMNHSVYMNMQLPWMDAFGTFLLNDRKGRDLVKEKIARLHLATYDENTPVKRLSGGNQQKVVVGKGLGATPKVLLMDDPTYGIDINAKAEISNIIFEFKRNGGAVMLISSEIEDILNDCNRLVIMKDFAIAGEVGPEEMHEIDQESVTRMIQ